MKGQTRKNEETYEWKRSNDRTDKTSARQTNKQMNEWIKKTNRRMNETLYCRGRESQPGTIKKKIPPPKINISGF